MVKATVKAVNNLFKIIKEVDYLQIDREDLMVDVGYEHLAGFQRYIGTICKLNNKKFFLSSHFLISLNVKRDEISPSIAETIDLANTIKWLRPNGIQLSEETATGPYPQQCIDIIRRIYDKNHIGYIRR